jgi:predicted nucleic acid-binding protein
MDKRYFLDTDIIVYSFDKSFPFKCKKSRDLITEALATGRGIISFQVVQEFLDLALKKFDQPLSLSDAREYCEKVLVPLCEVYPGDDFYCGALEIKERTGLSFHDSLIIQAALHGECATLFSEDIKEGTRIYSLTVQNPFR